jgi:hypothetical protein
MAVVSATALGLLAIAPSTDRVFLGLVAVFSFYFAFSGYRVLSRKRPADGAAPVDWVAVGLLGLTGVALLGMGGWSLAAGTDFGVVMLVFGAIALVFAASDVRSFRSADADRRAWFFQHLQRMGGAYIATVTAFATVNATFLPTVARWLLPTALGSVAIWYVSRRYDRRFAGAGGPRTTD